MLGQMHLGRVHVELDDLSLTLATTGSTSVACLALRKLVSDVIRAYMC